jgi:hypothetical protein
MTEQTKSVDPTRVKLGSPKFPVRFSYAFILEPKIDEKKIDKKTGKPEEKYSCMVMIPKDDPTAKDAIEAGIRAAADTKIPGKKIPSSWSYPLRDGDEEADEKGEHMKGHWFFNCTAKRKPQLVGTGKWTEEDIAAWDEEHEMETSEFIKKNRPEIGTLKRLDKSQFKSGDYGRISVNFYYFENETKGIAVGLGNVQKLKDGESLGGSSTSADDDFDDDMEEGFAD